MSKAKQILFNWWNALPKSARWTLFIGFVVGISVQSAVSYLGKKKIGKNETTSADKPVAVAADIVNQTSIKDQFVTYAYLRPSREITLRPNANVTIREVTVQVGQVVKAGQPLAYSDSEYQRLKSELDAIDLEMRNLDFAVTLALAKRDFMARNDFKQKQLEHRASQIRRRMAEIDNTGTLTSPISGVISEIALKAGDFIDNVSNYHIKVVDASSLRINLFLPESVALKLKKGDPVTLTRSVVDDHGDTKTETGSGQIEAIAPMVDPKTGSVYTDISTKQMPSTWIAGMFVEVGIVTQEAPKALTVPNVAVVMENGHPFIYKIVQESAKDERKPSSAEVLRAKKIQVELGLRDAKLTEIRSGVEVFDQIVVEGQGSLVDGAKIEITR